MNVVVVENENDAGRWEGVGDVWSVPRQPTQGPR